MPTDSQGRSTDGQGRRILSHTVWRYRSRDPVRFIYLDTNGPRWRVNAVERSASGKLSPEYFRYFDSYSDAMKLIDAMIARTGGPDAWHRQGPEFTGTRFS